MKNLLFFIILLFGINPNCTSQETQDNLESIETLNPLLGSWKMKEIHWHTKDTTYSINQAEPGIFFFTESSYAIMWTPIQEARTAFVNLSKPTDPECISGFKSVVFNAGSYTFTDSTLTSEAYIAKVPGFEGGKQFYNYRIDKNTLHLTMYDEIYPDGTKPKWSGKYQTEFVLIYND